MTQTRTPNAIDSVLHPTELGRDSRPAFAHALRIAIEAGATLHVLHVDRNPHDVTWSDYPGVGATLTKWGHSVAPHQHGVRVKKTLHRGGNPARRILQYVADHDPALIVVSTHQWRGLDRFTHTSVAEPVARASGVSTLFVPRGVRGFVDAVTGVARLRSILVPVAERPDAQPAFDASRGLLSLLGAPAGRCAMVHVGDRWEWPSDVGDHDSERFIRTGDVIDGIIEAARNVAADLIVMTSEGHMGVLDTLLGDTTERVVRRAHCPVLSVPVG